MNRSRGVRERGKGKDEIVGLGSRKRQNHLMGRKEREFDDYEGLRRLITCYWMTLREPQDVLYSRIR